MPQVDKQKVLKGRKAVEAYRQAHAALHKRPYYRGIHAGHTPLLEVQVAKLEQIGWQSSHTDFESRKTEVLEKFFSDSMLLNVQELGYEDMEDFRKNATKEDREALRDKWC